MNVALRPVTRANVRAICDLQLAEGQEDLVAPAAFTVAEGHYEPGAVLNAIYADDEPVGVLLVETEGAVPYLVRFMITKDRQGDGIGQRAVELLIDNLSSAGWTELELSFVPRPGGAEGFWKRCGFTNTGRRTDEGEPVFKRQLPSQ